MAPPNIKPKVTFFLRKHLECLDYSFRFPSFPDVLTLEDDTVCNTFKETAMKMGLLQNDDEE